MYSSSSLEKGKPKRSGTNLRAGWVSEKRIVQNILFLHVVTVCDTTSAQYGQGKVKGFKVDTQLALLKTTDESSFNIDSMS